MIVERSAGATSAWIDVFDRVLDKGVMIDPSQRVALSLGIDLVAVKARIVVVSIETYLKLATPQAIAERAAEKNAEATHTCGSGM